MSLEEWARQVIQRELHREVKIHDNGKQPSMYDLRIGTVEAPDVAIECVGAIDSIRTETWNVGQARGPLSLALKGDWTIIVGPKAKIRAIELGLEPILQELEERGIDAARADFRLRRQDTWLFDQLDRLGIEHAWCSPRQGTGLVHMSMYGTGGAVDSTGASLAGWVEHFLRDPRQADVLAKLDRSRAAERHVFVFIELWGAPASIELYFTQESLSLPTGKPSLPREVTGVWVVHNFGKYGVRWEKAGWRLFPRRFDVEVDA